jgi:hypothetical protein
VPTPSTQQLLDEAESFLDAIDAGNSAIQPDRNQAGAMLSAVGPMRTNLANFLTHWQQIRTRMQNYIDALSIPDEIEDYQAGLDLFTITLAPSDALNDANRWANPQRLNNAYHAVINIINRIARVCLQNRIT